MCLKALLTKLIVSDGGRTECFYEMRGAAFKFGTVNSAGKGFFVIMIIRVAAYFRRDRGGISE